MHKVAIIQARMGSSRLPGKVLKIIGNKPVLHHVMGRVSAAIGIDEIIVATTTEPADDAIAQVCAQNNWPLVRGSETDVLSRYAMAARETKANIVVRVTSDCPLFSPLILDDMLAAFDPNVMDYMSTNYPTRSYPVGLDCEVMRADLLLQIADTANDPYDREHVTPYFYRNPDRFSVHGITCQDALDHMSITLDTVDDYERLVRLVAAHPALLDPRQDVLPIVKDYFDNTKV